MPSRKAPPGACTFVTSAVPGGPARARAIRRRTSPSRTGSSGTRSAFPTPRSVSLELGQGASPLGSNLHESVTIVGLSNRPGGTDAGGDPLDLLEDHRRAPRAEAAERRARRRAAALALRER